MNNPVDRLPHAYPFRMLDSVLELSKEAGFGIKNFSSGDFFFSGRGGLGSEVPGFMIIEAMAQLSGLILNYGEDEGSTAAVVQISLLRFLKPVGIPETMKVFSTLEDSFGLLAGFSVRAFVGDVKVAEGELVMARVE